MDCSIKDKIDLVTRNLKEHIGVDNLQACLEKTGTFNIYWGTAPTGRLHIAYFLPMSKLADFLKSDCEVTILFANLHAFLDNMKAPWELLDKRTQYYEILIKGLLKALNVPLEKLKFIRGTDFQLKESYTASVFQIVAITSVRNAIKAGCEVVKQNQDPWITSLIYPLLQGLDEEFLGVDAQFGGLDQRKIFMYSAKYLPKLGFSKRAHLMNPMIPGLIGGKMSASEEQSKIDLLDSIETIKEKLRTSEGSGSTSETNAILAFIKHVIWYIKSQLDISDLNRFTSYEELEKNYQEKQINEDTLKNIVETALCTLMKDLRGEFISQGKENLIEEAYPLQTIDQSNKPSKYNKSIIEFPEQLKSLFSVFPQESVISTDKFPKIIEHPTILWSCRASGEPHIGYLVPLLKLANLSNKGWKVIILIEDIGAFLHSNNNLNKPTWDQLGPRAELYKRIFKSTFKFFNGDEQNLTIISGSEFQLSKDYSLLMYQYLSRMKVRECQEIVKKMVPKRPDSKLEIPSPGMSMEGNSVHDKKSKGPLESFETFSSILYPCIAVIDQAFLKATVRLFGDHDFVDCFDAFAENLQNRLHPIEPKPLIIKHIQLLSLSGRSTMSSPNCNYENVSPIDDSISLSLLDKADVVNKKIKKSFFDSQNITGNFSLNVIELIILPLLHGSELKIKRKMENGGDICFTNIDCMKRDILNNSLHPADVKSAVAEYLKSLYFEPINDCIDMDRSSLLTAAYPKSVENNDSEMGIGFNPNCLDLRVATVRSVEYEKGGFKIELIFGNDLVVNNNKCLGKLTPGDSCIVVIRPSTIKSPFRLIGVLCTKNFTKETDDPIRLKRNTHHNSIVFTNFDLVGPHLKETDEELILMEIEKNCSLRNGKIQWNGNKSSSNVNVLMECNQPMKISVEKFLGLIRAFSSLTFH